MPPLEYPHGENTYFIDAEHAAEMARLTYQGRLLTKHMGEMLPVVNGDRACIKTVLDIACGPGEWALDVAQAYPATQVMGVDNSKRMIDFACTISAQVPNVQFRVMDVTRPLEFSENSFEFINARLIFGFLSQATWPLLLQECVRVLRPGGILRITEGEAPLTNKPAVEQLTSLLTRAFWLAKRSFSPDGRQLGTTPMLGKLLQDAGLQVVGQQALAIDFSAGTELQEDFCHNHQVSFLLMQPYLVAMGVATQEQVTMLYEQAIQEMRADDLCAVWYFRSVSGQKSVAV